MLTGIPFGNLRDLGEFKASPVQFREYIIMKVAFLPLFAAFLFVVSGCKSSEEMTETAASMGEVVEEVSVEDAIVNEHIEALGGQAVLDGINSMRATGQVEMPAMDMTLLLTMHQKAPQKFRMSVDIPQMGATILNGYDGETAWEDNPMAGGPTKLTGERKRAFVEQADMNSYLVGAEEAGFAVSYIGDEELDGSMTHKFNLMRADSTSMVVYLDAATKMEKKVTTEAPNPMTGAMTTVETKMSDYREVGGTMKPYRLEVVIDGEVFQVVTFQEIQVNVPVDDQVFVFPGE